jgi:hypothetical protein
VFSYSPETSADSYLTLNLAFEYYVRYLTEHATTIRYVDDLDLSAQGGVATSIETAYGRFSGPCPIRVDAGEWL